MGGPPPIMPPAIQAGMEGVVSTRWDKALEPGKYTATLVLKYAPNSPSVTAVAELVDAPARKSMPSDAITTRPGETTTQASKTQGDLP